MELEEVRIEESGDAIYRVDMDDREQKAFIELGIQFAMICGAAANSSLGFDRSAERAVYTFRVS